MKKNKDQELNAKIEKALKDHPQNWEKEMEKIGFTWFPDDYSETEVEEEEQTKPLTLNQEFLVAYFEGQVGLEKKLVESFQLEKDKDEPNYPLFRKYFRSGNSYLKRLILFAINENPTSTKWLWDLSFYHQFHSCLKEVVELYTNACVKEDNLSSFESLVRDFYCHVTADGFDVLHHLLDKFEQVLDKKKIIFEIKNEYEADSKKDILF